jgi:hypothetical protein
MRVVPKYLVSFLVAATLLFMVVQPVQAEIFVTTDSGNAVQVFSETASGSDAPLRTITGITNPRGIFVDDINGEIFVARQGGQIQVYDINADGAATPLRTITQDNSADYHLGAFQGVHVDVANNEIFVANRNGSVTVFNRTDSGTLAPKRSIYGASTDLGNPRGVWVQGDELFVANNSYPEKTVLVFSRTANGDAAPVRVITNTADPSMGELSQIMVANGEVTVADFDYSRPAIRTWPSTTNGDVAPTRMITGGNTQLIKPRGVALCTDSNSLVVANRDANTLTFYSASANGDVAPTKSLNTLDGPRFLSCTADSGPASIPTLNNWGIVLASLLLALGTIITLRRKHS